MQEEAGISAREVCQESIRHGPKTAFYVFWKILVVVFLPQLIRKSAFDFRVRWQLTLFRRARSKSCTDFPSYFLNLPKFSVKARSRRACQSGPTMLIASFSRFRRFGSLGSRHMISNLSEASCRKFNRRLESQKKG